MNTQSHSLTHKHADTPATEGVPSLSKSAVASLSCSVCLSVYLSVCLSVCLSISLSHKHTPAAEGLPRLSSGAVASLSCSPAPSAATVTARLFELFTYIVGCNMVCIVCGVRAYNSVYLGVSRCICSGACSGVNTIVYNVELGAVLY